MRYKWGIPSYNRSDNPLTVDLLNKLGYTKEDIIVSTQTEDDYEKYKKAQGDKATIIYDSGDNDSMNRNTILKQYPDDTPIILADDDIKDFCRLSEDGKKLIKIDSGEALEEYFDKMFRYCTENNAKIWAWYPIANAFFMKHTIDDKNILCGTIFGIINDKRFLFDDSFSLKGDYELALRYIGAGYNAIRFNGFTCVAKHRSKGGCEEARSKGENILRYKTILSRYPHLIKPSKRDGEIRFIGKVKHTDEKNLFEL